MGSPREATKGGRGDEGAIVDSGGNVARALSNAGWKRAVSGAADSTPISCRRHGRRWEEAWGGVGVAWCGGGRSVVKNGMRLTDRWGTTKRLIVI